VNSAAASGAPRQLALPLLVVLLLTDAAQDYSTGTAGQHAMSQGVCGGPLAVHYANLMSHTAFRQSLACVSLLYQCHNGGQDGNLNLRAPVT
jgi:hypothetical protein